MEAAMPGVGAAAVERGAPGVALPWLACPRVVAGVARIAGVLGHGQHRQGQRHGGRQLMEEVVHRSKTAASPTSVVGRCPCRRTSPVRPRSEASLGQMLRGGRSWPSDWKAGGGAEMAGKTTLAVRGGSMTSGGAVDRGAT